MCDFVKKKIRGKKTPVNVLCSDIYGQISLKLGVIRGIYKLYVVISVCVTFSFM